MNLRDAEILEGDVVRVAIGRGWRKAKVLKKLGDNLLRIKIKGGRETEISADHVLTQAEAKSFAKSSGTTKVVRNNPPQSVGNDVILSGEQSEGDMYSSGEPPKKFFKLLG